MKVHTLVVVDGSLYFPTGDFEDASKPSLLMRMYDAGDCDTCPWPMVSSHKTVDELRVRLAIALYDERETNSTFGIHDKVALPDGELFDFDLLVP
jgi:hypothetical protein